MDYETFLLGDFSLEGGFVLPEVKLAYKKYDQVNADKTNVILLCSSDTGTHSDYEFLIGQGRSLDPTQSFVISTNLFIL